MNRRGCYLHRLGYADCDGMLDPAHFCPQQRIKQVLKRRGLTPQQMSSIVWDTRTYTLICRRHHELLDKKMINLTEDQYPPGFRDWAAEHQFEYAGPRDGWIGLYVEPRPAA